MKNIFLITLLAYTSFVTQAQNIDRQIVAGSGGYITTGTAQVSFTLGETAIQYLSTSGAIVSQGFQQGNNTTTSSITTLHNLDATVTAFPNPFINFIEVRCNEILNDATFQISDASGRIIQVSLKEIEVGKQWHIEVGEIPSGNYWITVSSSGKRSTFSLIHITH